MLGAIAGDIIGSMLERGGVKTTDFPLFSPGSTFTDDTVLTLATAHLLLGQELNVTYTMVYKTFANRYPDAGYGQAFRGWMAQAESEPYNSWGNGSAMRVSPIAYAFESADEVIEEAERSAACTHNHPEGIKGAQATALAIFLARKKCAKEQIKTEISQRFNYNLDRTLAEIRPHYTFDVSCQGSVPESIIAFLESTDYEDAVRKAISLGGDSDTMACIAGGIAQAYYGEMPQEIIIGARERLPKDLLDILDAFEAKYRE